MEGDDGSALLVSRRRVAAAAVLSAEVQALVHDLQAGTAYGSAAQRTAAAAVAAALEAEACCDELSADDGSGVGASSAAPLGVTREELLRASAAPAPARALPPLSLTPAPARPPALHL